MSQPMTIPASTKALLSTDRTLEINNLFALVGAGIIIKLMFHSRQPANSTIWGYGLTSISLFLLLMVSLALGTEQIKEKFSTFFSQFVQNALPTLILLILLTWVIFININYYKKISSQQLPEEYFLYSFLSSGIILLQAVILFMFFQAKIQITKNPTAEKNQDSMDYASISYLFALLNSLLIGMMQIVLEFFTTDG